MDFKNITIIGVGLIGSSFALALKRRGFNGRITGIGRNENNLLKAKGMGVIDAHTTLHAEGIKDADLVLLASSAGYFEQIMKSIKDDLAPGTIVTDVGSVKAGIMKQIENLVPDGVHFVGGHPIAGKECSGVDAATADLFDNARCIITPNDNTDRDALIKVIDLWNFIGTDTVVMSPEHHDLVFAAVSHLPHVVAYALVNTISDVEDNILQHGGKGLKDMTRIALSPTELWRDICACNREELLKTLKKFSSSIAKMTDFIEASDWTGLEKEFKRAKEAKKLVESD
ncbi:MAG: prephenate dehydrogenase/arogenate dehydrogenase family protein [Nitrospirota bacterium]